MSTIGLFGGSFDPITSAHIKIGLAALDYEKLDEVWYVVAKDQPLKDEHYASIDDRIAMIEIAVAPYEKLKVCTIEKDLDTPSYTLKTIEALEKQYPNQQFKWIMGADSYVSLPNWYESKTLMDKLSFIVLSRNKTLLSLRDEDRLLDLQFEGSSSDVRSGQFKYVDSKVKDYIFKHHLYLEAILRKSLSKKRADHVLRVVDVALEINEAVGLDPTDVYVAAILHDITKEDHSDRQMDIMKHYYNEHLHYHPKVYHQFTGAYAAKHQFKIENEAIVDAIMHHTTGTSDAPLAKLIYIADKVERGRPYPTEAYIQLSKEDLNAGFQRVKADAIQALKEK